MAGKVESFDESKEFDFLKKDPGLPKAGATEFKVEGSGIPGVDLSAGTTKTASGSNAVPATDIDSLDSDIPPEVEASKKDPLERFIKGGMKKGAQRKPKKNESIFSNSSTTPADLDKALIEKYQIEWLEWDPETIWQTIHIDFGSRVSRINKDKIMAAKLLHVSDEFWRHWEVFQNVVLAFNNITPLFDRVQDISIAQVAYALSQVNMVRKEEFQEEVLYYIANQARQEGLIWLPEYLEFAQAQLDELNPPDVEQYKAEIGARWDAIYGEDYSSIEFGEDVYGVHLAKLAAIEKYLEGMAGGE